MFRSLNVIYAAIVFVAFATIATGKPVVSNPSCDDDFGNSSLIFYSLRQRLIPCALDVGAGFIDSEPNSPAKRACIDF